MARLSATFRNAVAVWYQNKKKSNVLFRGLYRFLLCDSIGDGVMLEPNNGVHLLKAIWPLRRRGAGGAVGSDDYIPWTNIDQARSHALRSDDLPQHS